MAAFFKNLKKIFRTHGYLLVITALFSAGAFLRLYNFENRLIFGPEQGMSLLTSASNLEKFSLLGETNWIRATSAGHIPFHGALYSYFLLPLLIITNFRVLPVTYAFAALNLSTALLLFFIAKKMFGKAIATLSVFFFVFSDVMIHHSLFAWIVNPTPLLGVLTLWLVFKLAKDRKNIFLTLLLGCLSGFGFGLQSFYLLFAIFLFLLILIVSRKRFLAGTTFFLGVLLGSLPTVIFDIRHDFYHVKTYWQFFLDMFTGQASSTSTYYNFLFLYPYLFLFYAFITKILFRTWKPLALIPTALFLYGTFTSPFFNLNKSTGMFPGITLKSLEAASYSIAQDNPPVKFNVATLWDFDTRAHPLRYILGFYYHKKPLPYEEYQNLDALYVFAPEKYDMKSPKVWELEVYYPYKIKELPLSVSGYRLYKLTK